MLTEKPNTQSENLDQLSALEIARLINAEDHSVAEAVAAALPQIAEAIDAIVDRLAQGGRLFYVGAGTSGRLGILDAVECPPTFGTPPEQVQGLMAGGEGAFIRAVEGAEDDPERARQELQERNVKASDVVVGIAASGRTPYTIGAIEYARSLGAATIAIACNVPAPLLDAADIAIGVPVGPEVLTGSTRMKAGTAQKMVLNILSTGSMVRLGKAYGNLMVDVQITNKKLAQRARRILMQVTQIDEAAATELLQRADGHVKTAIVMHHLGLDAPAARAALDAAGGHLRTVLEG